MKYHIWTFTKNTENVHAFCKKCNIWFAEYLEDYQECK